MSKNNLLKRRIERVYSDMDKEAKRLNQNNDSIYKVNEIYKYTRDLIGGLSAVNKISDILV